MNFRSVTIVNFVLLILLLLLQESTWYLYLLTVAQIIYVPLILDIITRDEVGNYERFLPYATLFASFAVFFMQLFYQPILHMICAGIYLIFTILVAIYGVKRFLDRGFIYFEEFMIDIGLIYLAIGGLWFFAYEVNIDTGFSPILTWLTSIHFHYSAFLFPIFLGLLGRLIKNKLYQWAGAIILVSPIVVALGITFSVLLEVISVLLYIIGIYACILLSSKVPFKSRIQKLLVRLSFGSIGITILFSLAYAFGNFTGYYTVTINFMLVFHGLINAGLFGLVGIIGWFIMVPRSNEIKPSFPISKIRGRFVISETILNKKTDDRIYNGLVDKMGVYQAIDLDKLAPSIADFYENTNNYRLMAEVKWHKWFIPFAGIYKLFSRVIKQLNLPLSNKKVEMAGDIISVLDKKDGRNEVRAWIRKIEEETVFIALYSQHYSNGKTYMNIALPLPYSTMIGVLDLQQIGKNLRLTSKRQTNGSANSGIYLSFGNLVMKLPLEEQFDVSEVRKDVLEAKHQMWIFSLPFLSIKYVIQRK
jgi:YndJ-like protein